MQSKEQGFTLIEIFVVVTLIVILAGLAIYNFQMLTTRAYDAVALDTYRQLKTRLLSQMAAEEETEDFRIRRMTGPVQLPAPLQEVSLPAQVFLRDIRSFTRIRRGDEVQVLRIDLSHNRGEKRYRFTQIGERARDQVLQNNRRR